MITYIAIDPGAGGGIAVLFGYGGVVCYPMPDTEGDIAARLSGLHYDGAKDNAPCHAIIEEVGGYIGGAGNPGSAMFKFGRNFGFILGVLAALEVPTRMVKPQEWQKGLGLGNSKSHSTKSDWKNHLKGRAQQLYPACTVTLKTADALLILQYATWPQISVKP